jgi:type IV pilus assembly protein PilM
MRAGIGSRPWVGIDLGTYSVKVVTVQGTVGGPRYRAAEISLPGTEDSPDRPLPAEVVAQAVSEALGKLGQSARSRGIAIGVSGPDVIVKQITLPLLDESEVGQALRFEARKHLPFDPQTMVIDFQVLGRLPSERKLDILLAAVARDHLDRHLEPLTKLGIDPEIVDATPLALANAIADEADVGLDAQVLLDIGHGSSHLTIYQRGQPFFARRFDFGGRSLTRAIAADSRISYAEAEEWKLAVGGDEPGLRISWEAPEMQAIEECLRRQLVEELHRSFAFYRTQAQLAALQRIWISGGSSRLPGLPQRLGDMLGIPVLLFDPLDDGTTGMGRPGPQFAQAFGLTSRTG